MPKFFLCAASGMSDSPSHLQLSKEEQTTSNKDIQISLLYHICRFCVGRVPDSATNSLNFSSRHKN